MKNEDVEKYSFNDPDLDELGTWDYCAKAALIERRITKNDYITMHGIIKRILHSVPQLSLSAKRELKEIMYNI